jgi:hypothetical protein
MTAWVQPPSSPAPIRFVAVASYARLCLTAAQWALAFSMSLNGGFLLLASVVLWLIKISTLPLAHVVPHCGLYQAAAGVTLLAIPAWMLMVRAPPLRCCPPARPLTAAQGWRSICLECFWRFITFCALGALILATWIAMFATSCVARVPAAHAADAPPACTRTSSTPGRSSRRSPSSPSSSSSAPPRSALSAASTSAAASRTSVRPRRARTHTFANARNAVEVQAILARDNFARATFTYSDEHAFAGGERGAPDNVFLAAELGLAKKPLPFGAAFGTSARSSMLSFSSGPEKAGLPRPAGGFAGAGAGAGGLQPPPRAAFNPKRASAGSASSGGSGALHTLNSRGPR